MAANERNAQTESRANQDRDTNVGGRDDQASKAAGPTAGRAASPSTDDALGLAGAPDRSNDDAPATGLETGNVTLGSSTNAAQRPDGFNRA